MNLLDFYRQYPDDVLEHFVQDMRRETINK